MSVIWPKKTIEYPESDGKPMGETDVHIEWMIRIRDILRQRYRAERVYVASNLLVYYEEGNPRKFVVPDGFVVLNCDPASRRTFKIWEEGRVPNVVLEVTSRSSREEDTQIKPETYARIGVTEYFLYDPLGEYLDLPLQGFHLREGVYRPIDPDASGRLPCRELDMLLGLVDVRLVMYDGRHGTELLTAAETAEAACKRAEGARQRAEGARQRAEGACERAEAAYRAEQAARQASEQRAQAAEAELQRLREELSRRDREA
jgi:Uma2 family endonuclease